MRDAVLAGSYGVVAAVLLNVFFGAVRHRWPESYSTLSGALEAFVIRSLGHYLLFRTVPVYMAAVFLAVTVDRLDLESSVAVAVMAIVHIGSINGRAIAVLLRRGRSGSGSRRGVLVLFHLLTGFIIVAASVVAVLSFPVWRGLIPVPRDVVLALWTGLIAAVLAAHFQNFRRPEPTEEELVERAREDVGASLWDYAQESAWSHDCDPALVRAVIATEATQRPRWVRDLERMKGKVLPSGSYGAAQMSSPHPLSDEESIDALAASFAGYYPERTNEGNLKRERLAARLEGHNPTTAFVTICMAVYDHLQPYAIASTEALAHDGRPVVEVQSVKRRGEEWVLQGTASVYEANVAYIANTDGDPFRGSATAEIGSPLRGDWKLRLPLSARSILILEETPDSESLIVDETRTAYIDLDDPW